MLVRSPIVSLLAGCTLFATVSCGSTEPKVAPAFVMFLNMTGGAAPLDISANGRTDLGNHEGFCLNVDPSRPDVVFRDGVTGTLVPGFTPSFLPGERYTVFIMRNSSGTFEFTTVAGSFTPSAGNHALRFFNGGTILGDTLTLDIYAGVGPVEDQTPVLRNVRPGSVTNYVEIPGEENGFEATVAGTKNPAVLYGFRFVHPGTSGTLFVAPRSSGFVEDCTVESLLPVPN